MPIHLVDVEIIHWICEKFDILVVKIRGSTLRFILWGPWISAFQYLVFHDNLSSCCRDISLKILNKIRVTFRIHPLGTINVCTFHGNPSNSCWGIYLWTDQLTNIFYTWLYMCFASVFAVSCLIQMSTVFKKHIWQYPLLTAAGGKCCLT